MASMIPRLPKAGSEACNPSEVNKGVQGPELDVDACTQDNIRVHVLHTPRLAKIVFQLVLAKPAVTGADSE